MKKKILLVDDSSTVILMEKMILAKGPYEIVTARDGVEGIAKAKSEKANAISPLRG
jgi:CheY-like chemotaxis protein